ncbi:MAG: cytochrome c3 family protein [Polyangia bacterium]
MAQLFHRSTNVLARTSLVALPIALGGAAALFGLIYRSPYFTSVFVARRQPVPFSHKHHVGGLGIDCRYCHDSVEKSAFAGLPALETCMHCHSQIWADSPLLQPVREGYRDDRSLVWGRVNQLPDYVYFDHSIHVNKGVGCESCHGRVDQMPLTWRQQPLTMKGCLSCHREPERHLRPREHVFQMGWRPDGDPELLGRGLVRRYRINKQRLADCYVCHR